jgi:hypothetical protein
LDPGRRGEWVRVRCHGSRVGSGPGSWYLFEMWSSFCSWAAKSDRSANGNQSTWAGRVREGLGRRRTRADWGAGALPTHRGTDIGKTPADWGAGAPHPPGAHIVGGAGPRPNRSDGPTSAPPPTAGRQHPISVSNTSWGCTKDQNQDVTAAGASSPAPPRRRLPAGASSPARRRLLACPPAPARRRLLTGASSPARRRLLTLESRPPDGAS